MNSEIEQFYYFNMDCDLDLTFTFGEIEDHAELKVSYQIPNDINEIVGNIEEFDYLDEFLGEIEAQSNLNQFMVEKIHLKNYTLINEHYYIS